MRGDLEGSNPSYAIWLKFIVKLNWNIKYMKKLGTQGLVIDELVS
jgi:hypothetical protein